VSQDPNKPEKFSFSLKTVHKIPKDEDKHTLVILRDIAIREFTAFFIQQA